MTAQTPTGPPRRATRRPRRDAAALLAALVASPLLLAACSSSPAADGGSHALTNPLVMASTTPRGAIVVVPMGELSQPLNTFWELLVRDGPRWRADTPPDVATNGGLVTADDAGGSLLAGVLPSASLAFSPLASARGASARWSPSVLDVALARAPDALAVAGRGAFALAAGSAGVLAGAGTTGQWRPFASRATLERAFGTACEDASPTALGVVGRTPVVGAACAGGATARPLVARIDGAWDAVGPTWQRAGDVDVLRLASTTHGLVAIVAVRDGSTVTVDVARSSTSTSGWSVVRLARVAEGAVVATATSESGAAAVLLAAHGGVLEAALVDAAGAAVAVPAPPAGTDVLVLGAGDSLTALRVVDQGVWAYDLGAETWHLVQHLVVPLAFGSSS